MVWQRLRQRSCCEFSCSLLVYRQPVCNLTKTTTGTTKRWAWQRHALAMDPISYHHHHHQYHGSVSARCCCVTQPAYEDGDTAKAVKHDINSNMLGSQLQLTFLVFRKMTVNIGRKARRNTQTTLGMGRVYWGTKPVFVGVLPEEALLNLDINKGT